MDSRKLLTAAAWGPSGDAAKDSRSSASAVSLSPARTMARARFTTTGSGKSIPSESAIHESERARFQASIFSEVPPDAWSPDLPVDFFLKAAADTPKEPL